MKACMRCLRGLNRAAITRVEMTMRAVVLLLAGEGAEDRLGRRYAAKYTSPSMR